MMLELFFTCHDIPTEQAHTYIVLLGWFLSLSRWAKNFSKYTNRQCSHSAAELSNGESVVKKNGTPVFLNYD